MAKGISASVNKVIQCRSDQKLGRVLVDLSGKKVGKSKGGNQYAMKFRGDKIRMSWEYFLRGKAEAPDKLEQWLTDIRVHGIPETIRSDDASELKGGKFCEICRQHRIKQELTSPDRPQL